MNISHLIPYLGKAQGGPVESLRLLASAQAEAGHFVQIGYTGLPEDGAPVRFAGGVELIRQKSFGPIRISFGFDSRVFSNGFKPDVIHSHGLWWDIHRKAAGIAAKHHLPHVISPCGMLQHGALRVSHFKKRLAWIVFQKKSLISAAIIHAKSEAEAKTIRKLLPNQTVTVLPNPIETIPESVRMRITVKNKKHGCRHYLHKFGLHQNHRVLLYVGRIHPVKGLMRLIKAWKCLFHQFPSWRLVIVGPDEGGYIEQLRGIIDGAEANTAQVKKCIDLKHSILFTGPIYGDDRWLAYADADLLTAPSDFENFGQSIAEALSMGVPVITTTGTPWEELKKQGCGWWVAPEVESLTAALEEAMSLSDAQRKEKGEIGKELVRRFSPSSVAEQMCELYEGVRAGRA